MFEIDSPVKVIFAGILFLAFLRLVRFFFSRSSLDDLPGPDRASWITGNLADLFSPDGVAWHEKMSKRYGRTWKVHGLFGDQELYVTDPKAMNVILGKDQDYYEETSMFVVTNELIYGEGLLATLGEKHKRQRKLLNPVFSRARMAEITPIFNRITRKVRDAILKKVGTDGVPKEIDMMYWFSRVALEYIGQAGLGHSLDDLGDGDDSEYSKAAKGLLDAYCDVTLYRQFLPFITSIGNRRLLGFLVKFVPFRAVKNIVRISDVLHKTSLEVFAQKKRALKMGEAEVALQVGEGKDIMSVLLRANENASRDDSLPEKELLGQMNTLIFSAHDTTASALTRILHTLSHNPAAQDRLREEVTQARELNGDLLYEDLDALPFLDAVVRETLRVYPPINFFVRTTRKDIILPLGTPVKTNSGRTITEVHLKNNTDVILGIGSSNRDPEIWGEDAEEWKPERWIGKSLEEVAKEKLPGIYSGMMTFFGGQRACIGVKFSLLEMKVLLSFLLETFEFEPSGKEISWKSNIIESPRCAGSRLPTLPIKVSVVKARANAGRVA